jgi:hypothetical protein
MKREFEDDSSEANTPASFVDGGRDAKRVKFENENNGTGKTAVNGTSSGGSGAVKVGGNADSDEDEDFEDAI